MRSDVTLRTAPGSLSQAAEHSNWDHQLRVIRIQREAALAYTRISSVLAVYDTLQQVKAAAPERARALDLIARIGGAR